MNEEHEFVRRARVRSLVLLVVVLLVGMLIGAAEERYLLRHATTPGVSTDPRTPTYPGVLGRMDLTASQRAAIDSLIAFERPRYEAILERVLPDLHAEADTLRLAVRAVLTPAQQQLFDREPRVQGAELVRRFSKATAPPDTTP
jgi:hypothetical protein